MADQILRSKITFGDSDRVEAAKLEGKINEFDVICLDGDTKPKMGWLDRDGNTRIVEPGMSETEVVTKVEASVIESKAYADEKVTASIEESKAYADEKVVTAVEESKAYADEKVETELATKADAEEVNSKFDEVNAKFGKYAAKMYEIARVPDNTLVDYFDKEIRIMIPSTTDFANLNNAIGGDPNTRYVECRIYAPDGAVRHRFDFGGTIQEGTVEAFSGCTDEYGRIYIANVPPIASYDETTATWTYYGANSTVDHYVGWDLTAEWFDENDIVIASSSVRINLSNENCHYAIEPYYVGEMMNEVNTLVDKKVAEVASGYEIVEF